MSGEEDDDEEEGVCVRGAGLWEEEEVELEMRAGEPAKMTKTEEVIFSSKLLH